MCSMSIEKYVLPNGNIFVWLGKWKKEEGAIDNVLILAGGDVLFLKIDKVLPLWRKEVRKDLVELDYRAFMEKYELPIDDWELYKELHSVAEILEKHTSLSPEIYQKYYDPGAIYKRHKFYQKYR